MDKTNILKNFGVPVVPHEAHFVASCDEILIEMYDRTYEQMCLADHAKAEQCSLRSQKIAEELAESAYKTTWKLTRNEELCSLVSDDLRALIAISAEAPQDLNDFQRQRIAWYERGHFPCGYRGAFPDGKWVVA